ncbi:MAG: HEAT repeat domain-containing protein [Planctomycetota bacterium]
MNRFVLSLLSLSLLLLPHANSQGVRPGTGSDDAPETGTTQPGKGPQIPFDEGRWEFWWYYNREPHIGLRQALTALEAGKADVDRPFETVTRTDREESLIPTMVGALRDSNPFVRLAAMEALAKTQDPGARPPLFSALHDQLFEVRVESIVALGVWGDSISLPRLESILGDSTRHLQERTYAALAIGMIGGPLAAESLKQRLPPRVFREFPVQVQTGIAYGVGLTRDPDCDPLIRALLEDPAVDDFMVRSYLILSLGKCGNPDSAAVLLAGLKNSDMQFRRSAAIALGILLRKAADETAVKALIGAAHDDNDLMVKNFSFISLGYVGGELAVETLRKDLSRATKASRSFVALALGLLGDPETVPLLLKQFEAENDPSIRGAMAISLGLHRDGRASPDLRKAFQQAKEPVFRGYAALALGMIGDVESIQDIQAAFAGANDVEMIANLATSLGLLGDRTTVEKLSKLAATSKNEFVRQSLLYAMGLIGDRAAISELGKVIGQKDEVAYVRGYAVTALGLLVDREEVRAISQVSSDSNYTIMSDFLSEVFRIL